MRYIFRRPKPEDLAEVKKQIPNLDGQLGQAAENYRRFLKVPVSPLRYVQYTFVTRKQGTAWSWIAPSVELVAEDEKGLFALAEHCGIQKPSHLAHL